MNWYESHISTTAEEMENNELVRLTRTKMTCDGCWAKNDGTERKAAVYYLQAGFKLRYYYCEECAKAIAKKLGKTLDEIVRKD